MLSTFRPTQLGMVGGHDRRSHFLTGRIWIFNKLVFAFQQTSFISSNAMTVSTYQITFLHFGKENVSTPMHFVGYEFHSRRSFLPMIKFHHHPRVMMTTIYTWVGDLIPSYEQQILQVITTVICFSTVRTRPSVILTPAFWAHFLTQLACVMRYAYFQSQTRTACACRCESEIDVSVDTRAPSAVMNGVDDFGFGS